MTIYSGDIKGNVIIRPGDDTSALTSVGGDLYVRAEGAQFPALTSVGGYLSVQAEGAQFPALTSVGGDLSVQAEGAQFPALTSVGGYLYVQAEGAQFPALTKICGQELPHPETAKARLIAVAKAALANPTNLVMERYHNESGRCGTAHCIAGWAVHLEGDAGYDLEDRFPQPGAGNILLGAEASKLFFLDNDKARSALHKVLADAGEEA